MTADHNVRERAALRAELDNDLTPKVIDELMAEPVAPIEPPPIPGVRPPDYRSWTPKP